MELNALLAVPVKLPSLPKAVALLMSELAAPEPDLRRVNLLFASDPALAARLLQQANAPSAGMPGQVSGIPEALALLGLGQLRELVAVAPLATTSRSVPGVDFLQFWRYSLRTAKLARSLAGSVQQNPLVAYTAGLLHGLGELVLHMADTKRAESLSAQLPPLDLRRARLEQRVLGYSYAHISAGMALQWRLPLLVTDAVEYHCAPFEGGAYEPLAGVLHLAAWRARAAEARLSDRELAVSFPGEVGVALGLDIDMVLQQDPIDWSQRADDAQAEPDAGAGTGAPR